LISSGQMPIIVGKAQAMSSSFVWKLVLASALGAAILLGAVARAPRRPIPRADLRALVAGALLLYGVGLIASLSHRPTLAAILYGSGIAISSLAGWMSRGADSGDPPPGSGRSEEPQPPPDTRTGAGFDWDALERQFREPAREREHQPVG
jgi:hypothetical protein